MSSFNSHMISAKDVIRYEKQIQAVWLINYVLIHLCHHCNSYFSSFQFYGLPRLADSPLKVSTFGDC